MCPIGKKLHLRRHFIEIEQIVTLLQVAPQADFGAMPFLEHRYAAAKISWVPAYDAAA